MLSIYEEKCYISNTYKLLLFKNFPRESELEHIKYLTPKFVLVKKKNR